METNSGLSNELLGFAPDELAGYSVMEIARMIEAVQAGLAASEPRMTEEEIQAAAEQIYADAN